MPAINRRRRLTFAAAVATACSAMAASTAAALNPQPLPPRVTSGVWFASPETFPSTSDWVILSLNPQPEPPG